MIKDPPCMGREGQAGLGFSALALSPCPRLPRPARVWPLFSPGPAAAVGGPSLTCVHWASPWCLWRTLLGRPSLSTSPCAVTGKPGLVTKVGPSHAIASRCGGPDHVVRKCRLPATSKQRKGGWQRESGGAVTTGWAQRGDSVSRTVGVAHCQNCSPGTRGARTPPAQSGGYCRDMGCVCRLGGSGSQLGLAGCQTPNPAVFRAWARPWGPPKGHGPEWPSVRVAVLGRGSQES